MARRRVMNRQELRANFEAAERQKVDGAEEVEDEEGDEEEDEEEAEAEAEGDEEAGDEEEGDEEEAPAPKKPKKKAPAKTKPRTRAVKTVGHARRLGRFQQLQPAHRNLRLPQKGRRRGPCPPAHHRQEVHALHPTDQGTDRGEEGRVKATHHESHTINRRAGSVSDRLAGCFPSRRAIAVASRRGGAAELCPRCAAVPGTLLSRMPQQYASQERARPGDLQGTDAGRPQRRRDRCRPSRRQPPGGTGRTQGQAVHAARQGAPTEQGRGRHSPCLGRRGARDDSGSVRITLPEIKPHAPIAAPVAARWRIAPTASCWPPGRTAR